MPYIKQEDRHSIATHRKTPSNPGELNFLLTKMVLEYLEMKKTISGGKLQYHMINDVMGALEGAKLEFYRRVAAPYEDEKIKENGDVYG